MTPRSSRSLSTRPTKTKKNAIGVPPPTSRELRELARIVGPERSIHGIIHAHRLNAGPRR